MITNNIINYLDDFASANKFKKEPGFCTALIHDGEVIYSLSQGLASMEHNAPLTSDSVFYLASVSKQFTAACILKLVHDKKLKLNQDARGIIKEIDHFSEKITIQNLLNHTSGIADYFEYLNCQRGLQHSDYFENKHIMEIIDCFDDVKFKPNHQHEYSNSNYIILAEVVKKVTGKPISKYAKETMFKPLGMKHTSFDDDRFKVIKNRVSCYTSYPGSPQKYRVDLKNSCTVGDGGVLSSINDLVKWELNIHNNKVLDGAVLKGLTKTRKLATGEKILYANGLELSPEIATVPYIYHTGGFAGFHTLVIRVPSQKISLLFLSNNGLIDFDLTTTAARKMELIS